MCFDGGTMCESVTTEEVVTELSVGSYVIGHYSLIYCSFSTTVLKETPVFLFFFSFGKCDFENYVRWNIADSTLFKCSSSETEFKF